MKKQNEDGVKLQAKYRRRRPVRGLAPKQKKAVNELIDKKLSKAPEKKRFDYVDSTETISPYGFGYLQDISLIPQDVTVSGRTGNQVTPTHIGVRFDYHARNGVSLDSFMNRVVVFQWRPDTSSEAPSISDLLASSNYIAGFWNSQDAGQFQILYDERFHLFGITGSSDFSRVMDISIPEKIKGLKPIRFNTGSTAGENHIFLMVLNDDNNVSVAYPQMRNLFTRIKYTDM